MLDRQTKTRLFNDSYERVLGQHYASFFEHFYRSFLSSSPQVAKAFENTDESRRFNMLEESLLLLMDYSTSGQANDDLRALASFHKKLNLPSFVFNYWLDSLIKAMYALDRHFNREYEEAWRETLGPGVAFVRDYQP